MQRVLKGSENKLSISIDKWCASYLLNQKQNQKANYVPFIIQVAETPKNNWLIKLLSKNIYHFLSNVNLIVANIVWQWIANDVKVLKTISNELENTYAAELLFIKSLPILDDNILSEVKVFSANRGWFRLHATILKSQYGFVQALKEHLIVDLDDSNLDGIELLVEGVIPSNIVSFTIENGDKRLINCQVHYVKQIQNF